LNFTNIFGLRKLASIGFSSICTIIHLVILTEDWLVTNKQTGP